LQLQDVLLFVQGPDASKCRIEVPDHRLRAPPQDHSQVATLVESSTHILTQRRVTRSLDQLALYRLALGYIVDGADQP
jgi:hypothetical protein